MNNLLWTQDYGIRYKGGGGSTGRVSFPEHMTETHIQWVGHTGGSGTSGDPQSINTTIVDVMETAFLTNPLDTLSYSDPATDITAIETEFGELDTLVTGLDASTDWGALVDSAVTKLDSAGVLSSVDVGALVTSALSSAETDLETAIKKALEMVDNVIVERAVIAFAEARRKERARVRTQYKANMSSIGAERSSAYALGLALLEMDFERELGQYQTEFSTQLYTQGIEFFARALALEVQSRLRAELTEAQIRDDMLMRSWSQMLQYKQFVAEMKKMLTELLTETKRITFNMDAEYVANTADLNWKHGSWDMNAYASGIAVLGGISGSQFVPDGPTKAGSAIGGALQGAGTGAAIGSVVPGVGTAVGAAVGAGLGLASGLFG